MKALSSASQYLRKEGIAKFFRRGLKESRYRLRRANYWCRKTPVGFLAECRGNRWTLDGLTFSLDAPGITTQLKSGFVWGTYERNERDLVARYLRRDLPVIEGGACIGVVACVTNRLLDDPTQHVVVEANPELLPALTRNRDQNKCAFEIVHAAIDQSGAPVTFHLFRNFLGGSVQLPSKKQVTVPAVTVGALVKERGWDQISLILDIEGAEIDLIRKETDVLRDHVAVLIVEMHPGTTGEQSVTDALATLQRLGFSLREQRETVYVFTKTSSGTPTPAQSLHTPDR